LSPPPSGISHTSKFSPLLIRPIRFLPTGVGAIASALKTNTHLTNLNLGDNDMVKEGGLLLS
jgi:hypothetical protein